MSHRFNPIFLILLGMSFLSAFALPARLADLGRVQVQGLFTPISWPIYRVSTWARSRMTPPPPAGDRVSLDVQRENESLRQRNLFLLSEINRLQAVAGERQSLGDLQSLCDRVSVSGADSGTREGLFVTGALGSVVVNQPAIYSGGLAGKVDRIGIGSAHVRLVTDPGFSLSARFIRFVKNDAGVVEPRAVGDLLPIVQGAGEGRMAIINIPLDDALKAGVKIGDWVVVSDDTFPPAAQNSLRVGQVTSIGKWTRAPLFADIRLQSSTRLMGLADLYIMTRGN